jgi:hypothetical protein
MFYSFIYFALFQVAYSLAIAIDTPHPDVPSTLQPRSSHLDKRGITTGEKVAIGICVPAAALAVGLGIVILAMYPAQLRKLRAQNGGADVTLADVMNGKVTQRPAPPPYTANRPSTANETTSESDAADPPSYPVQPKSDTHVAPPVSAEARQAV